MLRGGDGVPTGRVHHDDTAAGCLVDIDVIHTNTRSTNDLELGGCFENLGGDLCLAAHNQRRVGANNPAELVLWQSSVHVDLESVVRAQGVNTSRRDRVGNQNLYLFHRAANVIITDMEWKSRPSGPSTDSCMRSLPLPPPLVDSITVTALLP